MSAVSIDNVCTFLLADRSVHTCKILHFEASVVKPIYANAC
jgi:hypothetical protein